MWQRWLFVLTIALSSESLMYGTGLAQTIPRPLQPQTQSPVTISPIESIAAPTSRFSANILTPSPINQLQPSTELRPRGSNFFNGAGRGLPGMPGGPSLKSSMGAQDPTAAYMTPPVVGPLYCDPAVNVSC
jgi:hypothetical protein